MMEGRRSRLAEGLFPQFLLRSAFPGRENCSVLDREKLNAFLYCLFLTDRQICAPYSLPFEFTENDNPYRKRILLFLIRSADRNPGMYNFTTIYANSLDDFVSSRVGHVRQGLRITEPELLSRVGDLPSPFLKKRSNTSHIVAALKQQRNIRYVNPIHAAAKDHAQKRFDKWNGEPLTVAFFSNGNNADPFKSIIGSFIEKKYIESHTSEFREIGSSVEQLHNFPLLAPSLSRNSAIPSHLSDVYFPALQQLSILVFGCRKLADQSEGRILLWIESIYFERLRQAGSKLLLALAEMAADSKEDLLTIIRTLAERIGPHENSKEGGDPLERPYIRCLGALEKIAPRFRVSIETNGSIMTIDRDYPLWLFIFALDKEQRAFFRHCSDKIDLNKNYPPYVVDEVRLRCSGGQSSLYKLYSCCVGKGSEQAGTAATQIITELKPDFVVFSGIAGGIKDVEIGDVVVATSVHNYETGKEINDTFQARPAGGRLPQIIEGLVKIAQREKFEILSPFHDPNSKAKIEFGQIVAGSKVVAERGKTYNNIRHHYNDALAISMEDQAIFEAIHRSGRWGAIVRGISDKLENKNASSEDSDQKRAADHAARVAIALHQSWLRNPRFQQ